MARPKLFVGSSKANIRVARAVADRLEMMVARMLRSGTRACSA